MIDYPPDRDNCRFTSNRLRFATRAFVCVCALVLLAWVRMCVRTCMSLRECGERERERPRDQCAGPSTSAFHVYWRVARSSPLNRITNTSAEITSAPTTQALSIERREKLHDLNAKWTPINFTKAQYLIFISCATYCIAEATREIFTYNKLPSRPSVCYGLFFVFFLCCFFCL